MNNAEVLIKFKGDTSDLDKKTDGAGSKLKSFASAMGKGFAVAGTAVATATVAVGKLVKSSVDAYAEYEQLAGGVETLFKDSASVVEDYANEAYKTAGLSANEYMSTVTSFSASLLQSLGGDTAKSAEYANQAVIDMSDNANKMGTSMEAIQNAYQGFAKQNFTMLDNLKLGYGGTRGEMERLIADANKVKEANGEMADLSIDSFADITEAIHIIQNEMGITGTTAKEASETIQGSLNMTKSSWENLVAGFSKEGADLNKLIDEFIDSALTFADNVIPVAERALGSIADAIPKVVDKLVGILPGLIERILPGLIQGAIALINGVAQALPQLLPILMDGIIQAFNGLVEILPVMIEAVINATIMIIQALAEAMPDIIPIIVDAIIQVIPLLIDCIPLFIEAGLQLIWGLIKGIVNSIPKLLSVLGDLAKQALAKIIATFAPAINIGKDLVKGLWNGIKGNISWITDKVKGFAKGILKGIKGVLGIHSPSTETAWMAEMMGLGMTKELEKIAPEIQKTIDSTFSFDPTMTNASKLNMSKNITVYNNIDMKQDPLGQMVSDIKTFSGGAKNDYNYGMS